MTKLKQLLTATTALAFAGGVALAEPDLLWFEAQGDAMTEAGAFKKDGPWTVALVFPDLSNSWRVQAVEEARSAAAADERFEDLIVTNYQEDVSVMISDVEDMLARGVDAIMIHTGQIGLLNEQVEKAKELGIPVINFGQIDPDIDYASQMWAGGESYGRTGGEWLVEKLPDGGEVWALRGIAGHSEDVARYNGMSAAIDGAGIEVTREDYGAWSYEGSKPLCESWVLSGDLPDAIWSGGADMTRACLDVFAELGIEPILMTGEGNNGLMRQWSEMGLDSMAASFPPSMFAVGLNGVAELLDGGQLAKSYWAEPEAITNDNLAEYYHPEANDNLWVPTTLTSEQISELFPR
ncbi:substrate-binding domain-containing protein [Lentibacter sp. XHP0401]|uniref:substrate-binding domain-containing protein n=1 Tax=Lentibacter sp. XHP0401 TaxID=2984334 RepID=UPI0021E77AB6|nr:substrate-binding domain-containing protein [Lentibacter sp. XHP0401]MCV2894652.1 substrate-binding domain-containing protein [Lentibacter sp. XHP0401]